LPETTRNQVLIRLVEALRPVSTEDEFKSVMLAWREYVKTVAAGGPTDAPFREVTVAPQASEAPVTSQVPSSPQSLPAPQVQDTPPSLAMPEPALTDMGDALKAPDADPVQAEPDAVVTSQVAQVEAQETQVAAPELTFLDDTRNNTMWFSMGSTTAPVVYAYIDPTCPYCAAAMKELDPQISAGSLQLRIVLAPLVSEGAPDVIAGILTSADPIQTFREHELAVANRTTSPVTPTAFPELGAEMANGIRANYDMVMTYELPGVPFFVFNTEEGEKYLSGVPDADSFASALPDDFTGSN
ncbi:MAG: thioredoxin domain-containing protein, partial [Roseibium sp.]|uniref:thioredoxin domain-containing protein n=1 Tax=Roseibium sp. TaxID=1936156 RepID=UPI003296DAC1